MEWEESITCALARFCGTTPGWAGKFPELPGMEQAAERELCSPLLPCEGDQGEVPEQGLCSQG